MAAEINQYDPPEDGQPMASMRPRRMAAEIFFAAVKSELLMLASMRPRRMAAEITGGQLPRRG